MGTRTMTEEELVDYFKLNGFRVPVSSEREQICMALSDIKDQEIRQLLERSLTLLAKVLDLYKYAKAEEVKFFELDFSQALILNIGGSSSGLINVSTTAGGNLCFELRRVIDPMSTVKEELNYIRHRMSGSVDSTMERLGRLLSNQDELEQKIKEWGLE